MADEDYEVIFSYARHNRRAELKQLLDEDGVDPELRDWAGNTILIIACQNGLKNMLKAILQRGGIMDTANDKGNTGLHFAFAYGYAETLGEYLISKGADDTIRNHKGLTCYDVTFVEGLPPSLEEAAAVRTMRVKQMQTLQELKGTQSYFS